MFLNISQTLLILPDDQTPQDEQNQQKPGKISTRFYVLIAAKKNVDKT